MDLNHYFEPVALDKPEKPFRFDEDMFGSNIHVNTPSNPIDEISNYRIAIMGVQEERNTLNEGTSKAPDSIRDKLYTLSRISDKIKIIDLGNMKFTPSVVDTYFGLRDVMLELFNNQVTGIILGGSQDLTYGVFLALEQLKSQVNIVTIDAKINTGDDTITADTYLQTIWKSPNLFRYCNLGHQQYLVNNKHIARIDKLGFEAIRLGTLRNNLTLAEPSLRDAHMVSFDINAIRQSDAPATLFPSPNGFYAEESCQLSRYAGLSDRVSCFGLYELNPRFDHHYQTSHLAAQMIWYFIEGFSQRRTENPTSESNDFKIFIINHEDMEHELTFYKSQVTNRWWMEVPQIKTGKSFRIACTQAEYQQASNHDIPDLWWRTFQRIN
ncbi:MAG: formimidoylglutamase [Bacteroidales bacterium]|nr:formimidoylglutamase [Bacteroidales bacterium]MBN2763176.1 formimidoylglutamase [Bacteroidales bacterium]